VKEAGHCPTGVPAQTRLKHRAQGMRGRSLFGILSARGDSWRGRTNTLSVGGGGGVYSESNTREARFLARLDQHAVAQRQENRKHLCKGPNSST
jgi:hypothetical protein